MLATEATALCHGRAAAEAAAETARRSYEGGELVQAALPSRDIPAAELSAGIPIFRLFAETGLSASNGEARRLVRGGGARINDQPVSDEARLVTDADLIEGAIKLSVGRKQHLLVRPQQADP